MAIYLNNAAQGFPVSLVAKETVNAAMARPPSGARHHSASAVQAARRLVAGVLDVDLAENERIVFCPSATLGINQVIQGVLRPGDHCLVDNRSHNAVLRTLGNLPGITFEIARVYDLNEEHHAHLLIENLTSQTRLVCLIHVSNVTGSVYPIKGLIDEIKQKNSDVAVLVDATQSVGLLDLSDAAGADFVVFNGSKYLHGVPGAAVLIARRPLAPIFFGGTGRDSSKIRISDMQDIPLEAGTQNEPAIQALAACLNEAYGELRERASRMQHLTEYLCERLTSVPEFRVIGRGGGEDRIGVVSMQVAVGSPQTDWAKYFHSQGIIVRAGLHCSPTIHEELGLIHQGTLRLSLGLYNTEAEIDTLIDAAKDFLRPLRELGL